MILFKYIVRKTINSLSLEEYDVNNSSVRFVDNYNKEVIYTNEQHSITLQFPFILNIKNILTYFAV